MDESKRKQLVSAGVDIEGAMERFMNNEAMYEKFLHRFMTGSHYEELEKAVSQKDWTQALDLSHNLKGDSGSLGFMKLHGLLSSQVDMLRQDDNSSAAAVMPEIMAEYRRLLKVVNNFI